jgi:hypothetical protein
VTSEHPRYRGAVIDAHCHYDDSTRDRAAHVNRVGGLTAAIHLWDCRYPPARPEVEAQRWRHLEPALLRCHVPDFSAVGAPGFERALERDVRAAADHGVVGIKVWKNLGLWLRDVSGHRIAVSDRRLEGLWTAAGELGLPVAIHTGDPPAFFAPLTDDNRGSRSCASTRTGGTEAAASRRWRACTRSSRSSSHRTRPPGSSGCTSARS